MVITQINIAYRKWTLKFWKNIWFCMQDNYSCMNPMFDELQSTAERLLKYPFNERADQSFSRWWWLNLVRVIRVWSVQAHTHTCTQSLCLQLTCTQITFKFQYDFKAPQSQLNKLPAREWTPEVDSVSWVRRPRVNIILLLQFIVVSVVKLYLISQWCIATPGFTVAII